MNVNVHIREHAQLQSSELLLCAEKHLVSYECKALGKILDIPVLQHPGLDGTALQQLPWADRCGVQSAKG